MNSSVSLIKVVFDFLSSLDDSQIEDLINKKVQLKLEPNRGKKASMPEIDENAIGEICEVLEKETTRENARFYLTEKNPNKATLKSLVKHYKIPMTSKATNQQMIDAIIEAVIGSKIRYDALYNTNLTK